MGKQEFINYLLKKVYRYPNCHTGPTGNQEYCVWTSGDSEKSSGPWPPIATWFWHCPYPGVPTPLSETGFINWGHGEPNNLPHETAIMLNQPTIGEWNNFPPSEKMSFMCQKPSKI